MGNILYKIAELEEEKESVEQSKTNIKRVRKKIRYRPNKRKYLNK